MNMCPLIHSPYNTQILAKIASLLSLQFRSPNNEGKFTPVKKMKQIFIQTIFSFKKKSHIL